MASPGDIKGQRPGSCGHIMASFDLHDKCARCRDKRIGDDKCVADNPVPFAIIYRGAKGNVFYSHM